jgi:hypothetical protein
LPAHGWYRCDARGNKAGVDAGFDPPRERPAFAMRLPGEQLLPEIYAEPLLQVVHALDPSLTVEQVSRSLPDLIPA